MYVPYDTLNIGVVATLIVFFLLFIYLCVEKLSLGKKS